MPSCPRSEIIREGEVGVYHVRARCVRRTFLCGIDPHTGIDYNHRRDWIRDFQQQLAALTGVEIGFHAELSNHIHLILKARPDIVETWSDQDVARRMLTLFRLVKSKDGKTIRAVTDAEVAMEITDPERVLTLRKRLSSVSIFMQALCENIGRRANRQDQCTGRFWESRFRAKSITCDSALFVSGVYVDLNQIRAGEALTPEESVHTSVYERIEGRKMRSSGKATGLMPPDGWLCELTIDPASDASIGSCPSDSPWRASDKGLLSISLDDYLELLDWTGRQVRSDKRGAIPGHLAPILDRLQINSSLWTELVTKFDSYFSHVVGQASQVVDRAKQAGRSYYRGRGRCAEAFG
jgi:hypothetical protein